MLLLYALALHMVQHIYWHLSIQPSWSNKLGDAPCNPLASFKGSDAIQRYYLFSPLFPPSHPSLEMFHRFLHGQKPHSSLLSPVFQPFCLLCPSSLLLLMSLAHYQLLSVGSKSLPASQQSQTTQPNHLQLPASIQIQTCHCHLNQWFPLSLCNQSYLWMNPQVLSVFFPLPLLPCFGLVFVLPCILYPLSVIYSSRICSWNLPSAEEPVRDG